MLEEIGLKCRMALFILEYKLIIFAPSYVELMQVPLLQKHLNWALFDLKYIGNLALIMLIVARIKKQLLNITCILNKGLRIPFAYQMDASGEWLLKHPKYMIFNVTFKWSFIISTIILVLWKRAVQVLTLISAPFFFFHKLRICKEAREENVALACRPPSAHRLTT